MLIAVINKSKVVTNEEAALMTDACAEQVKYHVAPAWSKIPCFVLGAE